MKLPLEAMNDLPERELEAEPLGRRRLLRWLTGSFLSLWGVGMAWVVGHFLTPPHRSLAERSIDIGPTDSLPVGRAQLVRHGREPIFVARTGPDTFVGLSAVCTHLHCVLRWDEEQGSLLCPCHEGAFDVNGNVLKGPPPSPLKRYRVETRLGRVYVRL